MGLYSNTAGGTGERSNQLITTNKTPVYHMGIKVSNKIPEKKSTVIFLPSPLMPSSSYIQVVSLYQVNEQLPTA